MLAFWIVLAVSAGLGSLAAVRWRLRRPEVDGATDLRRAGDGRTTSGNDAAESAVNNSTWMRAGGM